MNDVSKLMISDDELQLVCSTAWILTKRKIIDKINLLLGEISEQQKLIIEKEKNWLPDAVVQSTPKIARGENYLQLPYLLLDYPRCFEGENIFAVRTMFWWGNFFSITLHLSGMHKQMFQQNLIENIKYFKQDIFICINENQWQHHFEADNYVAVNKLSKDELERTLEEKHFIKLAVKFPLQSWTAIPAMLDESFAEIIKMLKA
jgi:hypothetical protein